MMISFSLKMFLNLLLLMSFFKKSLSAGRGDDAFSNFVPTGLTKSGGGGDESREEDSSASDLTKFGFSKKKMEYFCSTVLKNSVPLQTHFDCHHVTCKSGLVVWNTAVLNFNICPTGQLCVAGRCSTSAPGLPTEAWSYEEWIIVTEQCRKEHGYKYKAYCSIDNIFTHPNIISSCQTDMCDSMLCVGWVDQEWTFRWSHLSEGSNCGGNKTCHNKQCSRAPIKTDNSTNSRHFIYDISKLKRDTTFESFKKCTQLFQTSSKYELENKGNELFEEEEQEMMLSFGALQKRYSTKSYRRGFYSQDHAKEVEKCLKFLDHTRVSETIPNQGYLREMYEEAVAARDKYMIKRDMWRSLSKLNDTIQKVLQDQRANDMKMRFIENQEQMNDYGDIQDNGETLILVVHG